MPGEFTTDQLRTMLAEMLAEAEAEAEAETRGEAAMARPNTVTGEWEKELNPYAPTVWGQTEYDFTVPSGQTCRMRKPPVEDLLRSGILDRVTRLPAIAQAQIDLAEGQPPKDAADEMPDEETLQAIIDVMDVLVPLAVIQPTVCAVPKPDGNGETPSRIPGVIYTDAIELVDRVAIMERAIGGLKTLDAFRVGSRPAV